MPSLPFRRTVVLAGFITVALSGCSKAVPPNALTTTTAVVAPTTTAVTIPESAGDRLALLIDLATGLGDQIAAEGRSEDATIATLTEVWAATRDDVRDREIVVAAELEHQVELLVIAVDRRRPADADKATLNLQQLATSYLERFGD